MPAPLSVKLIPDDLAFKAWRDLGEAAGKEVRQEYQRIAANLRKRALRRFKVIVPRPDYAYGAFPWKSRKQQQAFFASKGFGRGIPTERTNEFVNSYAVHVETRNWDGFVSVENTSPTATYLIGPETQPFFIKTWLAQYENALQEMQAQTEFDLAQGWYRALFRLLGLPPLPDIESD